MPMLKRKTVNLPPVKLMAAALEEVRAIQNKHDAKIMLLVFLDRAALLARNLKALGIETDERIDDIFNSAREQAKQKPRTQPKQFDPTVKQEGKPS